MYPCIVDSIRLRANLTMAADLWTIISQECWVAILLMFKTAPHHCLILQDTAIVFWILYSIDYDKKYFLEKHQLLKNKVFWKHLLFNDCMKIQFKVHFRKTTKCMKTDLNLVSKIKSLQKQIDTRPPCRWCC